MSVKHVTMHRVARGAPPVPLHAATYRPGAAIAMFVVAVLIAAAFAVFAEDNATRVMMAAIGAMLVLAGVGAMRHQNAARDRVVRIDPAFPGLRFAGLRSVHVLFFAAAVVGIIPGLVALSAGVPAGTRRGGLFILLLSGVAAAWVAQQLWALRTPAGLTLTEHGLRGVRGSKTVRLDWDALERAEVVESKGAKLQLRLRTGGVMLIEPRFTGSDANVVAPVINFFLQHPEHRGILSTPESALELVEENARAVAG
jgi:hypothetical protein